MNFTKKLILGLAAFILVLLLAIVGLSFYVSSLLTEEFIVHQLEGLFNARFSLKKYNFSILSGGDLVLEEVAVAPRDIYANQATPLAKRPSIKNELLSIGKFGLHLDIFKIFSRNIHIKSFALNEPKIRLVLYKNGGNNLSPLFRPPAIVAGKKNPALTAAKKKDKPAPEAKKNKKEAPAKPIKAQDIPIAANVEKIGLENGDIQVQLQSTGDNLRIQSLNFLITDILFDPKDLRNKNQAHVNFTMDLSVLTKAKKETARFSLVSGGKAIPFNKKSGQIDPNITYNVNIKKGSYISGFTVLEKLGDKAKSLNKIGVSPAKLKEKFALNADTETKVNYYRGVIRLLSELKSTSKSYDLLLKKGAVFYLASASHTMEGEAWLAESDSRKLLVKLDKALEKNLKLSPNEAKNFRNNNFASIVRNGRLYFPFRSKGPFGNPDVELTASLPSYKSLLKSSGKQLLNREKEKLKTQAKDKAKEELKKQGKELLKKLF